MIEIRRKIAIIPYRGKLCLAIYDECNVEHTVATFNNDQAAKDFMEYLARFVGAERAEDVRDTEETNEALDVWERQSKNGRLCWKRLGKERDDGAGAQTSQVYPD